MKGSEGKQISALHPGAYQLVIATAYVATAKAGPLLMGREFTVRPRQVALREPITIVPGS